MLGPVIVLDVRPVIIIHLDLVVVANLITRVRPVNFTRCKTPQLYQMLGPYNSTLC